MQVGHGCRPLVLHRPPGLTGEPRRRRESEPRKWLRGGSTRAASAHGEPSHEGCACVLYLGHLGLLTLDTESDQFLLALGFVLRGAFGDGDFEEGVPPEEGTRALAGPAQRRRLSLGLEKLRLLEQAQP